MHRPDRQQRPPVVLVAQHEEWSARSFDSILGPGGYAVLHAHTGRHLVELVHRMRPDLVIVDRMLPDRDGIDVCRALRAEPSFGDAVPIIVTTSGPSSRALAAEAYAAGAWELVTQPLDAELLLLRIATFVRAKAAVDRARDESLVDDATGLYSLRGLTHRAREIAADATRRQCAVSCVALTTDGVPDAAEPELADDIARRIVEHVGRVCTSCGRGGDVVGRLGRHDIGIIATGAERAGVDRLIDRLRATIEASPISLNGADHRLAVRAGCSSVSNYAESPVDALELLMRAASALRHSRVSGPQVAWFDDIPLSDLH